MEIQRYERYDHRCRIEYRVFQKLGAGRTLLIEGIEGQTSQKTEIEDQEQLLACQQQVHRAGFRYVCDTSDVANHTEIERSLQQGHEPFLAAILDDLSDPVPCLIYADWLEEQGFDVRAHFMRLEVDPQYARSRDFEAKQRDKAELFETYKFEWFGRLASAARLGTRHGLPTSLSTQSLQLFDVIELNRSPYSRFIQSFDITGMLTLSDAESVFEIDYEGQKIRSDEASGLHLLRGDCFPNLRSLQVTAHYAGNGQLLGSAPFFRSLEKLSELRLRVRLSRQAMSDLAQAELPALRHLSIISDIRSDGVIKIAKAPWLDNLESLELTCNMTDSGALMLAHHINSGCKNLKTLDVVGNRLTQTGIQTLRRTHVPEIEYEGQMRG